MRLLSVPFHLSGSREPITESDYRPGWMPKVPAMYVTVYRAGSQKIRMERRKVYICDGTGMRVENMLD